MVRKGLITEVTYDGLAFADGSEGSGQVLEGGRWEWGETIPHEQGAFTLLYTGDIPADVVEDLDLDDEDVREICNSAGIDVEEFRQLAAHEDPVRRFGALQEYALHRGWIELDHYPQRLHPSVADDRFDGKIVVPLEDVEVLDHGADHVQYFPGIGVSGTRYTHAITGSGDTPQEALEDALAQLAPEIGMGSFREAAGELPNGSLIPVDEDSEDGEPHPEWFHYVTIRWVQPEK